MQSLLRLPITVVVLGVVALSQAEAHRAGGVVDGQGLAATSVHARPVVHGFRGNFVHRPRFTSNRPVVQRHFARVFPLIIPWSGGIWPGDGWPGYGYQPVQQGDAPPEPPQVIVIHERSEGRMTATPEPTPDDSYIRGCRAIANGYHCDLSAEAD
jgi:hypothetical protein